MTDFIQSIVRHLDDLRTRTYETIGDRAEKEEHYRRVISWIDPIVTGLLEQANRELLDGEGTVAATGFVLHEDGTSSAEWTLHWAELDPLGVGPVVVRTTFYSWWQHPHIHGAFPTAVMPPPEQACQNVWPLQVRTREDAEERADIIRAIVETELHAKICEPAFKFIGLDRNANDAWIAWPGYRRRHDSSGIAPLPAANEER